MKTMECLKFYYGLANKNIDIDQDFNIEEVTRSYERVMKLLENEKEPIYGIDTGYGSNVKDLKSKDKWQDDQLHLLNYLRVGVGDFLPEKVVRRALRIQAFKLSKGYSGVSPKAYKKLWKLSLSSRLPKVPKYGSLGASGDLVPMAHAIAPIFEDMKPQGPRDVICMVNTNSMMCSYAIELYKTIQELIQGCIEFIAQSSIAMDANMQHFNPVGFEMNPQTEPIAVCHAIREKRINFLNLYSMTEQDESNSCVQEKYSLRCAPHILGQICQNMKYVKTQIENEVKQISDNPLILKNGKAWHGGHFYAIGIATSADLMKDAAMRMCELMDRVVLNMMDESTSKGLKNNLQIGKKDHVKGIHQLMSSLYQRAKGLNLPSVMMSFSCEGNNQDVVPCSMNALNQLNDLIDINKKMLNAGLFISERGALMRIGEHVPLRLKLDNWRYMNAV